MGRLSTLEREGGRPHLWSAPAINSHNHCDVARRVRLKGNKGERCVVNSFTIHLCSHGVSHGLLSLSNTVMNNELTVQIAGFGLKMVFEMYRNTQSQKPQAHLFDAAGMFLGSAD